MTPRLIAADVVHRVVDKGAFSQRALASALSAVELEARDRGFATLLTYGTLTWLRPIDAALNRLLEQGLDSMPKTVRAHLRVAAFQIGYLDGSATFAAVDEAVEGIVMTGQGRLRGVANGVLRNLARQRDTIFAPDEGAGAHEQFGMVHSLPDWVAAALLDRLPAADAAAAMAAWNAPTAVHVRARGAYAGAGDHGGDVVAILAEEGITATPHPLVPGAFVVASGDAAATAAHRDGRIAVQDAGAQLANALLSGLPDGPILDACAGLGGKTLHLLDDFADRHIVAADLHDKKLAKLREAAPDAIEADRLTTIAWDLRDAPPAEVAERGPFAVVVVDAPCSALGTLGRHPETRWNRDAGAVERLADVQWAMLETLSPLVAPGGLLLYVVCTFTAAEGPEQVAGFLQRHPEFTADTPPVEGVRIDETGGLTLWPHLHATDGFYLAVLRRA